VPVLSVAKTFALRLNKSFALFIQSFTHEKCKGCALSIKLQGSFGDIPKSRNSLRHYESSTPAA
jgi:hypothetical protein